MLSIATSYTCAAEPGSAHAVLAGARVRSGLTPVSHYSVVRGGRCLVGVATGYAPRAAPQAGAVLALKSAKSVALGAGKPLHGDVTGLDFITDSLAASFQALCEDARPDVPFAATLAVLSIRDGRGTVLNLGDVRVLHVPETRAAVWVSTDHTFSSTGKEPMDRRFYPDQLLFRSGPNVPLARHQLAFSSGDRALVVSRSIWLRVDGSRLAELVRSDPRLAIRSLSDALGPIPHGAVLVAAS